MLFGASYYHEYQPYERLEEDIRLMQEAHISCVRVGESTWASWESESGHFELAWMDRTLDALHAAGIKVIFGTPTYALPPWLAARYPEIMAQNASGDQVPYGGRQNMDFTHPTYRFYAERLIRTLLSHFAPHPAIIGYQLDNETGSGFLFNKGVFEQFVAYLRTRYTSVEQLNEVWGLTYWSHRLHVWEDLWTPEGNTSPGYNLAWRRFQARLVTDFLAWQASIVREYARPGQFVTQDLVGGHGKSESDSREIAQIIDIVAVNPYHPTQDLLLLPVQETSPVPFWLTTGATGPSILRENADFGWSGQQHNFLASEINALSIFGSAENFPAYNGQWRLAAYATIARGANSILYWHWHTLHYGNETYWHGMLNHDLEPNRCFRELSLLGQELHQHDALLTDLRPDAQVAFLYSQESKYAFEFHPCLTVSGQTQIDRQCYQRIFDTFYRAFFEARAQCAIVHRDQSFEHFPVLVVPALLIADDELLQRLVRYAEQGGHLVLTFRSGYMDEHARARWQRAPGILRAIVGASYQEYSNLSAPLPVSAVDVSLSLPPGARATAWADGLVLEGATPLAQYEHPHFGRFPAVVTQPYSRGRVTYSGTLPDPVLGKFLATWVCQQADVALLGESLPEAVQVTTAQAKSGERLWFFSNYSWESHTLLSFPLLGRSLFSEKPVSPTTPLHLGPWDVQVVVEH